MTKDEGFESLLERMVPGAGASGPSDADAPDFPLVLGLKPLGVIGRGGTGWVYRAHDPVLEREVAVKVGRPTEAARKAMLREARDTARLAHPAILPVHRVVGAGDVLCIEFRLAPTTTLSALLADWFSAPDIAWPLVRRVQLVHTVASAVALAHEAGLVHGDLHPGNVAVGGHTEPYVLDWTGPGPDDGSFSGTASHAAPEQLRGQRANPSSDVFALGALAFETCTLRPMRPRAHGEPLGSYILRFRDASPKIELSVPDALAAAVSAALASDPGDRPSAAGFRDLLAAVLDGETERRRKQAEAAAMLAEAREALTRYQEGERRLFDEHRALSVQRTKVLGSAPIATKRPMWDAEHRLGQVQEEQVEAWVQAVEVATRATSLEYCAEEARAVLAELWWDRMRMAEEQSLAAEASVAVRRVRRHDRGRWKHILDSPAHITLETAIAGATVAISRFVERDRVLVPEVVDERPMPLHRHPLAPGSWLLTVSAPGYVPAAYAVFLGRLDHHKGSVRLFTAAEVGDGWCHVPASPFRMGGDPHARQPLDPCSPFVGDRFVMRTCVRSRDWLAFLADLPPDLARLRCPGEVGMFGGHSAFWSVEEEGGWTLPSFWDPDWPIMGVNLEDAEAYAAWLGAREGRPLRLPTEEEWEKAARGADGRAWPWGDAFDPTFCHMRESRPGAPRPAPVGSYPVDRSVYGVMDMAGGMREWTTSTYADGQMVIRGGTWGDDADDCRCACRAGLQPKFRFSFVGFRLVSEVPRPAAAG